MTYDYAGDHDYDEGYDPDDNPADNEDVWANLDGSVDWDDIETDHLASIVRGLEAGKWPLQSHKLQRAKDELAGRDKKWWQK